MNPNRHRIDVLFIPTITVITVSPIFAVENDSAVTSTQTIPGTSEAVEKLFGGWMLAVMAENPTASVMRRTQSEGGVEFAVFTGSEFIASILFLNIPRHVTI